MKETIYNEEEDMNQWMNEVRMNQALPKGEGIVKTIQAPIKVTTKFGDRYSCQIVIEGTDGSTINVKTFMPEQYPSLHPKSNMAKILKKYGCSQFSELLGKVVQVEEQSEGMWKIKAE